MVSLGFITVHPAQEITYITEIAKRAKQYGIIVYRFTPTNIEPGSQLIHGQVYDQQEEQWKQDTFSLPEFLYDRCFYGNDPLSKKAQPIMNWLKLNPSTTFIGYGLPNKLEIYQTLKQDKDLTFYLPHTKKATSSQKILSYLAKEKKIILKPISGSMGKGIIGLFLEKEGIRVVTHQRKNLIKKFFSTKKSITDYLDRLLQTQSFLCQPFLPIQDSQDFPFDLRILVQKNKDGQWQEIGRGIRKGGKNFLISNIGSGGEVIPFEEWSKGLSQSELYLLNENINTIISKLPNVLETKVQRLFELGIDLGLASDGSVWILDTNSKPGRKVVLSTSPNKTEEIYQAPLLYCLYLSEQSIKTNGS
ncbi:YheC/YheD family endospore coat-associated protein [Litchfieldia salsa]|uniref:YheC/D like ATP-grasp n=1 Tax=Litchfieldia salsa TaxID=930152 RepID=A0A1H0UX91_9BACI|nr:YheC/YheD family protein [Litchfieldia salsa]SDP70695.1 YheC/D like ATP-grasp [Litchfieldia salsa]